MSTSFLKSPISKTFRLIIALYSTYMDLGYNGISGTGFVGNVGAEGDEDLGDIKSHRYPRWEVVHLFTVLIHLQLWQTSDSSSSRPPALNLQLLLW